MKRFRFFTLLLLAMPFAIHAELSVKNPPMNQQQLSSYQQASSYFTKGEYDYALLLVEELRKDAPEHLSFLILEGAIYTKMKRWEDAEKIFEKAVEVAPTEFVAKFNLGEVAFLKKDYAKAKARFARVVKEHPEHRLAEFKLLLCRMLAGEAQKVYHEIDGLKPDPDNPVCSYALAARAFHQGDLEKGNELLQSANYVYGKTAAPIFNDSFVQLGWVKLGKRVAEPLSN